MRRPLHWPLFWGALAVGWALLTINDLRQGDGLVALVSFVAAVASAALAWSRIASVISALINKQVVEVCGVDRT